MADFGLAAQIGRGNAMPGAQQQQDPQNRMMQMMQLQQLQQNMMLAREQEGRAAGLYGLQRQNLQTDIEAGQERAKLTRAQTDSATQAAASATRAGTAEQGVLDYTRTTPQEERANPERLNVLRTTNPGAYTFVVDQINTARALDAKAKAEGFTAEQRQHEMRKVALTGMSSLLPAVRDQDSYSTLYSDFKAVDPTGAKIIGPKFTPQNVVDLSRRIQDLTDLDYGKDELGNQIVTNKRTGVVSLLAPARRPAAPAESALGNLDASFAANPSSPQMVGAGAAGLASTPMGMETPIIGQRAPMPAAVPPPGLGPKAAADFELTLARETAQAGVKRQGEDVKKQEGRQSVQETLSGMIEAYKNLGSLGELQRADMSIPKRLSIAAQARLPGDIATAVNFDAGSELTTINNLRQSLIPVLTEVMGSKAVDAARESEAILASLTSGGQSPASIARTLTNFSKKYGLGVTFKPEDLAYTPPAGATGSARGRPAPAPARAPTNAPVSVDDLLKKYNAGAGQ